MDQARNTAIAAANPFPGRETLSDHTRFSNLILKLLPEVQKGSLRLIFPGENTHNLKGREAGTHAELKIHSHKALARVLTGGQLGFCESYMDGEWSSPDPYSVFMFFLENWSAINTGVLGRPWAGIIPSVIHRLRANSRRGSRKNIYAHYDIGNDFYAAWLDETMAYSSGIFDEPGISLKQSQIAKFNAIIHRLDLKPEHHLLEIGCGWGGFAIHAAQTTGCRITAITVSQAQYDYALRKIRAAGLENKIDLRLQDYRDVTGQFDRIASIEMFEAVGEAYWPVYFSQIKNLLRPSGKAVLQVITIDENYFDTYRHHPDFIQRYIFPGGMLPSKSALQDQVIAAGLSDGPRFDFGLGYARTLAMWNENFQAAWPKFEGKGKFDLRFKRMWELYLDYCRAGFMAGTIDVVLQEITKPTTA